MDPKGGKVVKGYVSNPNKDPLYHAVEPLPEVTVRGIDRRGEKYAREGINKFARDYMVPAVSAIASFTPMAIPMAAGQVAAAYTGNTSDAEKRDALINAGLELVPTGLSLLGKGVSKGYRSLRKPLSMYSKNLDSTDALAQRYNKWFKPKAVPETKAEKMQQYEKDISTAIWDVALPDKETADFVSRIDNQFGTHYADTYRKLTFLDGNRGGYVKFTPKKNEMYPHIYDEAGDLLPADVEGRVSLKPWMDERYTDLIARGEAVNPDMSDYVMTINTNTPYSPSVVNHELGHLVDIDNIEGLAPKASNNYLDYLADKPNMKSYKDMKKLYPDLKEDEYNYLTTPTEIKSRMIDMKRRLVKKGNIVSMIDQVNLPALNNLQKGIGGRNIRLINDLWIDPSRYIDRMNNLTPLSIIPATIDYRNNKKK